MRFYEVDLGTSPGSDPGLDPGPDPGPESGPEPVLKPASVQYPVYHPPGTHPACTTPGYTPVPTVINVACTPGTTADQIVSWGSNPSDNSLEGTISGCLTI